jgi:hypothetical protein
MIAPIRVDTSIIAIQDICRSPRPERSELSLNRVAASLQVMLATRRAARNEALAYSYELRRSA